jgi:hypothetical protein
VNLPLSVSRVLPEQLPEVWPQVQPMVRRGLKRGAGDSTSEAEILSGIARGSMELWAVHDGPDVLAVIVLQVQRREVGPAIFVHLMAGHDPATWSETVQGLLLDYQALVGAYTIEALARPGLAKRLKERGWKQKAITMEIGNGR